MTLERAPEFSKVLDAAFAKALASISVAMPAKVTSVNMGGQIPTVDVQTCLGRTVVEEGREVDDKPVDISGVPLVMPGSGPYRLTFPIAAGDYVLLIVADRSTEEFIQRGGTNVPVHLHSHDITDCFAIPGIIAPPQQLSNVKTGVMVLGKNGNTSQPAARKTDTVNVGTLSLTVAGSATLTGTYTDPDGGTHPITSGTPFAVSGKINSGSSDVEIT